MTTQELQRMNLIEFHQHIVEVYEAANRFQRYASSHRKDAAYFRGMFGSTNHNVIRLERRAEIQERAAYRLRIWANNQICIKYGY